MLEDGFFMPNAAAMKPELLSAATIQTKLTKLPGWQVKGCELVKEFRFCSYLAGLSFVQQIALLAEALNHHPDMLVRWRKITVRLTTQSVGGLTALDFALAEKIEYAQSAPVAPSN